MPSMVSVHSSYKVIPSEPTPTVIFPLSLCDQTKVSSLGPTLYVYQPIFSRTSSLIRTLTTSLSKALIYYYPLAGRLCCTHGGRWELHCYAQGAQFLEANCDANLNDLGDSSATLFVEQLKPQIDNSCPIQHIYASLLAVQLTRFRCGGLTLGVALCRAINDGLSAARFLKAWAKLARGEKLHLSETPFLDRTLLDSRKLNTEPRFVHSEFSPPPVWTGKLVGTKNEAKAAIFKLTRDQVLKLKFITNR